MDDYYTEDITEFSLREIILLRDLLTAWIEQGLPKGYSEAGIRPMLSKPFGTVFLVNRDYQSVMMNGDKLERYYFTPHGDQDGFLNELLELDPQSLHRKDRDYVVSLCHLHELEKHEIPADWRDYLK